MVGGLKRRSRALFSVLRCFSRFALVSVICEYNLLNEPVAYNVALGEFVNRDVVYACEDLNGAAGPERLPNGRPSVLGRR